MAKILFLNPSEPRCGVHEFGANLFNILAQSKKHDLSLEYLQDWQLIEERVKAWKPDVMIANWHPSIPSVLSQGRPAFDCKQILIKHEPTEHEKDYDRVIFSDPTAEDHGNVRHIGRPLPIYQPSIPAPEPGLMIKVGVHGFWGASALFMIEHISKNIEMSRLHFRLRLPASPYADPDGSFTKNQVDAIMDNVLPKGGLVEVSHDFIPTAVLINWLAENDVNCYVRELIHWPGVSSALDLALVCGRPIAVNKCEAFRHFWGCEPSICLEDRSLEDIISSGDEPLKPLREKWAADRVLAQIESVIEEIL